jgi:predicted aldo/keto reductase-like oxidoreductase
MEPLKGGALINLPEDAAAMLKERDPDSSIASWGLRFAASLDAVKIVNSGMNRMSDMIDNVETFTDFKPLSEEEFEFLEEVSKTVRSKIAVACSYCKYCVEHCPNEIPIPDYFGMYNSDKQATNNTNFFNYGILSQVHGKASDCTECGACLEFCTQSLDIPKYMKDVAEYFEKEE